MRVGIGQDSHRFDFSDKKKKLVLGGVTIDGHPPLKGNSDADVILHAVTNAISGITGVNIIGAVSDELCLKKGITDSSAYLRLSVENLKQMKITGISISVECATPQITPIINQIKKNISRITGVDVTRIGVTATSGEGLTEFGKGKGIQVFACVTAEEESPLRSN